MAAAARTRLAAEIDGCRRALDDATAHLEEYGVSVGLVYKIELARQQLGRIERLVALATGDAGDPGSDRRASSPS